MGWLTRHLLDAAGASIVPEDHADLQVEIPRWTTTTGGVTTWRRGRNSCSTSFAAPSRSASLPSVPAPLAPWCSASAPSSRRSDKSAKTSSFLILEKNRSLIPRPPLEDAGQDDDDEENSSAALSETQCNLGTTSKDVDSLLRKNRLTDTMQIAHAPRQNDINYRMLFGTETWVFYPGKKGGKIFETVCDDTSKEFCWQKARIVNDLQNTDPETTDCNLDGKNGQGRCIHVLWRDGGDQYPYTCPSWIRHPFNWVPCRDHGVKEDEDPNVFKHDPVKAEDWQPCPQKFKMIEPDNPGGEVDLARWYDNAIRKKKECEFDDDTHCLWVPGKKLRDAKDEKDVAVDESDDDPTVLKDENGNVLGPDGKPVVKMKADGGSDEGAAEEKKEETPAEQKTGDDENKGEINKEKPGEQEEAAGGKSNDELHPDVSQSEEDFMKSEKEGILRVTADETDEKGEMPKTMIFNVIGNEWIQCVEKMRCRPFPLDKVIPIEPTSTGNKQGSASTTSGSAAASATGGGELSTGENAAGAASEANHEDGAKAGGGETASAEDGKDQTPQETTTTSNPCGPTCVNDGSASKKHLQCLVPKDKSRKPVCADKSAVRVIIPYDRTGLRDHTAAQPIQNGMLLNKVFL
ncbi:unnamed protein product [Amoebophrya sp. A120]|nr:unnamed protein product [Amoebophrya sp. A120]|eukprot:GSA120T00023949001.1